MTTLSYQEAMRKARALKEPKRLRAWQFMPASTPVKYRLWLYIFASSDGCYESLPTIAEKLGTTYKTVWKYVGEYVTDGDMAYETVKDKFGNERQALFCRVPDGLIEEQAVAATPSSPVKKPVKERPPQNNVEVPTIEVEVLPANTPAVKEEVRSPVVVAPRAAAARNTDTFAALVTTYVELLREEYPDSLLAAVDTQVAAAKLTQVWKKQSVVVSLLSTPEGLIELEAQVDLNVERIYEAVLAEQVTTNAIGYFSKVIADDVFIRTGVSTSSSPAKKPTQNNVEVPTIEVEVLPANTPTKTAAKPVRSIPHTATKPVRSIPAKTPVVAPVEKKPAAPVVEEPSVKEFFEAEVAKRIVDFAVLSTGSLAVVLGKEWMIQNIMEACFEDDWVTTQIENTTLSDAAVVRSISGYLGELYGVMPPKFAAEEDYATIMKKHLRSEKNAFRLPDGPAKQAKPTAPAYVEWSEDSPVEATTVNSLAAKLQARRAA